MLRRSCEVGAGRLLRSSPRPRWSEPPEPLRRGRTRHLHGRISPVPRTRPHTRMLRRIRPAGSWRPSVLAVEMMIWAARRQIVVPPPRALHAPTAMPVHNALPEFFLLLFFLFFTCVYRLMDDSEVDSTGRGTFVDVRGSIPDEFRFPKLEMSGGQMMLSGLEMQQRSAPCLQPSLSFASGQDGLSRTLAATTRAARRNRIARQRQSVHLSRTSSNDTVG